MTQAPSCERSSGGTSPRRLTASSAMPAFTWSADQRRVTTGGPIRTANAPWPLRCATIGASQASRSSPDQSMTGPSGR